jgi:hypothetical protein
MELKDYLHYYLYGKIWEAGVSVCTLIGIGDSYYTIKTKQGNLLTLSNQAEIKLVLRQTKDLTEAEAAELAVIYSGAKTVSPMKGIASNWHYFFCYFGDDSEGEVIVIDATGCGWYAHYFDKGQPGHRNIVNEHQAFHYLLRQQFDLFGLIPAGHALDAKTLK